MSNSNVTVCVRFRPLSHKERKGNGDKVCFKKLDSESFVFKDERDEDVIFSFDKVFYDDAEQSDVYNFLAVPIVADAVNGINGTIITYGQTGAGKTYSMEGPSILHCNELRTGLVQRVVNGLFECLKTSANTTTWTVKLSMVEIYLEKVRDLLDLSKDNLQIKESKSQGIFISGATEISIMNGSDAFERLSEGIANRAVGETQVNNENSRSSLRAQGTVAVGWRSHHADLDRSFLTVAGISPLVETLTSHNPHTRISSRPQPPPSSAPPASSRPQPPPSSAPPASSVSQRRARPAARHRSILLKRSIGAASPLPLVPVMEKSPRGSGPFISHRGWYISPGRNPNEPQSPHSHLFTPAAATLLCSSRLFAPAAATLLCSSRLFCFTATSSPRCASPLHPPQALHRRGLTAAARAGARHAEEDHGHNASSRTTSEANHHGFVVQDILLANAPLQPQRCTRIRRGRCSRWSARFRRGWLSYASDLAVPHSSGSTRDLAALGPLGEIKNEYRSSVWSANMSRPPRL